MSGRSCTSIVMVAAGSCALLLVSLTMIPASLGGEQKDYLQGTWHFSIDEIITIRRVGDNYNVSARSTKEAYEVSHVTWKDGVLDFTVTIPSNQYLQHFATINADEDTLTCWFSCTLQPQRQKRVLNRVK